MTKKNISGETYYQVLKIPRNATIAEIVTAYHAAKSAFSAESVAVYSLFSADESKAELARLEEAYLALSNAERKREYDRWLDQTGGPQSTPFNRIDYGEPRGAPPSYGTPQTGSHSSAHHPYSTNTPQPSRPPQGEPTPGPAIELTSVDGQVLRAIREQRALSLEDVGRITKIPVRFIQAIENEQPQQLPARVYLQGFVKNLAQLYNLDPAHTVKAYLDKITTKTPVPETGT